MEAKPATLTECFCQCCSLDVSEEQTGPLATYPLLKTSKEWASEETDLSSNPAPTGTNRKHTLGVLLLSTQNFSLILFNLSENSYLGCFCYYPLIIIAFISLSANLPCPGTSVTSGAGVQLALCLCSCLLTGMDPHHLCLSWRPHGPAGGQSELCLLPVWADGQGLHGPFGHERSSFFSILLCRKDPGATCAEGSWCSTMPSLSSAPNLLCVKKSLTLSGTSVLQLKMDFEVTVCKDMGRIKRKGAHKYLLSFRP